MTRKDYIALAAALCQARTNLAINGNTYTQRAVRECALKIADALARDNPRFNLSRFLEAAGVEL